MAMVLKTRTVVHDELDQKFHRLLEMDRSSQAFEAAYAEFDSALEAAMAEEPPVRAITRRRATA